MDSPIFKPFTIKTKPMIATGNFPMPLWIEAQYEAIHDGLSGGSGWVAEEKPEPNPKKPRKKKKAEQHRSIFDPWKPSAKD